MINDELSLDHPPRGIRMERSLDGDTIIRMPILTAITLIMFLFALFWNGFIAFYIIKEDDFGLFLVPFITLGLYTLFSAFVGIFGKCEIRLGVGEGSVFTGIGSIGRTKRFALQSVKSCGIKFCSRVWGQNPDDRLRLVIEINDGHTIRLPGLLEVHQTWLVFALGKLLNRPTE